MGGVQDRYLRHDDAGDMHVGRTVCGLPADDASFAALPPLFARESAAITAAKQICFPGLPANLNGVGAFALASLVHHLPYLRRELPRDHPLFGCSLFANDQLIEDLVAELIDPAQASITPTGIPPLVMLLSKIRHLEKKVKPVSPTELWQEWPASWRSYARHTVGPSPPPAPSAQQVSGPVFQFWGGGFHAFPPGVTLPTGTVDQAWLHWCCGDPAQRLPPFRHLTPADFTTRNERKRLSDFRFLMTRIDDRAKALGLSIHQLSMADAASVLEQCRDAVSIPTVTDRGRKRRRVQLVWLIVATELRKVARQSATALT